MKKLITLSVILFISSLVQAQFSDFDELLLKKREKTKNLDTVAWIYNGEFNIGANQSLLHNWSAGGELASLSIHSFFNGSLTRYNNRLVWTNNLDMAYGLFYAYSNFFVPRKTDDRIDFTTKYGYKISEEGNLYFSVLANAKTQFTNAYDYGIPNWDTVPTSRFLSPLYLTFAPGLEYRQGSMLTLFFSPLASRVTFVSKEFTNRNPEGAFGVNHGDFARYELGAYFTGRFEKALSENITYKTRLDLYSNYLAKDQIKDGAIVKKDNPGNIDLLWDNYINFKFFKYFSINIGITAIYDNDVPYQKTYTDESGNILDKNEPFTPLGWWQLKQFMSIGFNYKF